MRDLIAGVVAVLLLLTAASLATTLQMYRRRRQRARDSERALGRTLIAEIPAADDVILFSEDSTSFHYGDRSIDKDSIAAVRLLINGAPIASYVSRRAPKHAPIAATGFDRGAGAPGVIDVGSGGIARDRWDVAIETVAGTILVECGAIRERVSQELARAGFDAVKRDGERRDGA